jgi:CubicO group peptidase (beta-lactamase class C family)
MATKKTGTRVTMAWQILIFLFLPGLSMGQTVITQRIDDYIQRQVEVNGFNGTVLVAKDNRILFSKAYGLADREWEVPNTTDTKFSLASVSKIFTAICILQLAEKGHLSVDDKLSKFFPSYPKGDSVTLHMMLTHTSGLPNDFQELYSDHTSISSDSAIVLLSQKPYEFPPGSAIGYSNVAYFLLSVIVERASGQSFPAYVEEHICQVAGMENTGVNNNDSILHKRARNYYLMPNGFINDGYINWELNRGHDGIYSTAEDLYKLDRALYGTMLLSEASKSRMFTSYNKRFPDNDFFDSYGYGIMVNPYFNLGHHLLSHSGSFGGVRTSFNRFTQDNLFIAVLSNNQSESATLCYSLSAMLFDIPVSPPYKPIKITIDTTLYDRYVSSYHGAEVVKQEEKLYFKSPYAKAELLAESATKFFFANNPNRTVEFITGSDGRIHSLVYTRGGVA